MSTTYTFHVSGMHCKACELLIEDELKQVPGVTNVKPSLQKHMVEVTGSFGEKTAEHIAREISAVVHKHGYNISVEKMKHVVVWSDFNIAGPIAFGFLLFFVLLQKLGLVNMIGGGTVTYGTAFVVGIVASLSTCMAVVGGIVLSMSAIFAKEGDQKKPQILFHVGRLISFFVLGGVIGAVGAAFTLNTTATFILDVLVALVMLVLGINLLDVFPWAKKLQPGMPKFLAKRALGMTELNHTLTPFLVGAVTFFLPCGFTQSMQLFTLSTGSFLRGALTMFSFALGTLPVLALVSFLGSVGLTQGSKAGIFFKTAGLIVIVFAFFNLINALVVIGMIPPIFNF